MRLDLRINNFVFQALQNKQLILYESGFRRTFIHVRDMARSLLFALEHFDAMNDPVFNIGHESMNYTKQGIANLIKQRIDFYLHSVEVGNDADHRDYEVSYEKVRQVGFETSITLQRGLDELIQGMPVVSRVSPYSNI